MIVIQDQTTTRKRLPREAYTGQEWFDDEQARLFSKQWVFAGVLSDLKAAGDYRTVNAGPFPLGVIRQKDGDLRAYHNVCRHRGATLLDGGGGSAGNSLVCPYHRWTYGLDGRLRGAPHMASCFPELDRQSLGLKPAAVGVFHELVFVNPDPLAEFDLWITPLSDRAWPHDLGAKDIREAANLTYTLKCDWKVFVENAIDGYHLAFLHEHTLGGPDPEQNIWERAGDHMIWYAQDEGARHRLPGKPRKEMRGVPKIKSAANAGFGGVYYLFPTTLVTPSPYEISVSTLTPTGPGVCLMHVRRWVGPWQSRDDRKQIPGYDPKTGVISSDHWAQHPLETGDFQTEDVWICEKIQQGLRSPAFEPGPLARGAGAEAPIEWFHQSLSAAQVKKSAY